MPFKTFSVWLEDADSRRAGSRDVILDFLRSELDITNDDVLLGMRTTDIDGSVIDKLLSRGIISTSSPDIINRIKNGMTVQDLVDALGRSPSSSASPDDDAPF